MTMRPCSPVMTLTPPVHALLASRRPRWRCTTTESEPKPDVAAPAPVPNPWAEIVGPGDTEEPLLLKLRWSTGELAEAVCELRVLQLITSDGMAVHPAFQLRGGRVVECLREVLTVLRSGIDDPWTWARWLNFLPTENEPEQIDCRYIVFDPYGAGAVSPHAHGVSVVRRFLTISD